MITDYTKKNDKDILENGGNKEIFKYVTDKRILRVKTND